MTPFPRLPLHPHRALSGAQVMFHVPTWSCLKGHKKNSWSGFNHSFVLIVFFT